MVDLQTDQAYREKVQQTPPHSLIVVYFTAKWCGPCRTIHPVVAQLSEKHPTVVFLRADIEKLQLTAASMGVSSIPCFHFLRGGSGTKICDPLVGAQAEKLEGTIKKFKEVLESSGEDSGSLPAGQMDLIGFVDQSQVEALNQSTSHTKNHVFKKDDHFLESDCDEQLLLYVPFNQAVKLHSLSVLAVDGDRAPKTLKIFTNKHAMDFQSAESTPAVQELDLSADDVEKGTLIPLKFVKFQSVNSVTFFLVDNQTGAETTAVKYIRLIGTPVQSTNMKDFQRVSGQAGEVHD